jgi:hypothetical protein
VRRGFLVTLIPRAFSHALCSACALLSAAVFGGPTGLHFGVDILITRDIRLAPTDALATLTNFGADVVLDGCQHAAAGWAPTMKVSAGCR